MLDISNEEALKVYKKLLENNIFFEYNTKNNLITIVRDEGYILKDEKFDINKLGLSLDDENKEIINKFKELVLDECGNEQVVFKAFDGSKENIYLIETFKRHATNDNICGQVKKIKKIIIDDEKLKGLERIDEVTGLMSKTSFRHYIDECINNKSFFALAIVDLDFIKEVKELYGHIIENSVYEEVADSLSEYAKKNGGEAAKLDGEEFAVLIPFDHAPLQMDMRKVCMSIRNSTQIIKNTELVTKNLTVTIGICKYPFDGLSMNELFNAANRARFRGLAKGRACYVIYNPVLHKSTNVNDAISKYSPEGNSYVDTTIFIGDILNSLLLNPTKAKALSKIGPLANVLKVDRITVYKRDGSKLICDYTWTEEINIHKPMIEVTDFPKLFKYFVNNTLAINDSVEYKRNDVSGFIDIPQHVFAFTMLCVGPIKASDYIFSFEIFSRRRIWTSSQLLTMKILARIIMSYYLLGE